MFGPTEDDEGDQMIVERGAVIAQDDESVTVYGVGMTDEAALALVIAYAQAAQQTHGMTRQ